MTRTVLASFLAAALALTPMAATPARAADTGEIGRFLLGAGALFIIGSALSNSNRSGNVERLSPPRDRDVIVKPRHSKVVPAACLRRNSYDYGPRLYFPRHCLKRNMKHANRLPGACLTTVWTDRGQRNVYAARCLRDYGWVRG